MRNSVYTCQLKWISENVLAFNPTYDYQGYPIHPGHDFQWMEELGELAGTSSPIDAGWFALTLQPRNPLENKSYNWFLDPPNNEK